MTYEDHVQFEQCAYNKVLSEQRPRLCLHSIRVCFHGRQRAAVHTNPWVH